MNKKPLTIANRYLKPLYLFILGEVAQLVRASDS